MAYHGLSIGKPQDSKSSTRMAYHGLSMVAYGYPLDPALLKGRVTVFFYSNIWMVICSFSDSGHGPVGSK